MCGEHEVVKPDVRKTLGSSPHVRGTPIHGQRGYRGVGIIPACAGNTALWTGRCLAARDHPRMCGEHISSMSGKAVGAGSSPHVRGTPGGEAPPRGVGLGSSPHVRGTRWAVAIWFSTLGIIPACAGNTFGRSFDGIERRDHPRMCGEHSCPMDGGVSQSGSSPHVRGTPSCAG